jgi:hypothetical protein
MAKKPVTALTTLSLNTDQLQVYESMTTALQTKTMKALQLLRNMGRDNIYTSYQLGEIVREIAGDEPKYGDKAVVSVSEVLGEHPNTLWRCKNFAVIYTRERIEELLNRSEKTGFPITLGHFLVLSGIEGDKAARLRKEAENLVIQKNYTIADLDDYLAGIRGKGSKHPGPSVKPPKSPIAGLGQMTDLSGNFSKRSDMWDKHVFLFYERAGADQLSEAHLKELRQSQTSIEHIRNRCEEMLNYGFSKVIPRVERVLKTKGPTETEQKKLPAPAASANGPAAARKRLKPRDKLASKRVVKKKKARRTKIAR